MRVLCLLSIFWSWPALGINIGVLDFAPGAAVVAEHLRSSTEIQAQVDLVAIEDITFAKLSEFDVLLICGYCDGTIPLSTTNLTAVREYFEEGGGVVMAQWWDYTIESFTPEGKAQAQVFTPILNYDRYRFLIGIDIPAGGDHPILDGVPPFSTGESYEFSPQLDEHSEALLSNEEGHFLAIKENGGRSVYVGLQYFDPNLAEYRQGGADVLFKNAVLWAAGNGLPRTSHHCFVKEGKVKCIGDNRAGQLGLEDTNNRGDDQNEMGTALPAVDLGANFQVQAIATGGQRTCAVSDKGKTKCFGANADGELGLGDTVPRGDAEGTMGDNLAEVNLGTGFLAQSLALGAAHTCVADRDGKLKCFGNNSQGQLGLGHTENLGSTPAQMGDNLPFVDLGHTSPVQKVVAGRAHTCVLFEDKTIKCFGANTSGQLGTGNPGPHGDAPDQMGANLPFVRVVAEPDLATVRKLAAGSDHTCALLNDGTIKCWGANQHGQLGLGSSVSRGDLPEHMGANLPRVDIGRGQYASDLFCGGNSCCALLVQGTAKCWGENREGQLGLGDTTNRGISSSQMGENLPFITVDELATIGSFVFSQSSLCVGTIEGKYKCYGNNKYGQLGSGHNLSLGGEEQTIGRHVPYIDLGY